MKKIILSIAIISMVAISFTSCKKEVKTTETQALATEVYQCPMDCEHGKSYTKTGTCPVCKMKLTAKKAGETKKEDHSGHNH